MSARIAFMHPSYGNHKNPIVTMVLVLMEQDAQFIPVMLHMERLQWTVGSEDLRDETCAHTTRKVLWNELGFSGVQFNDECAS